MRGKGVRIKRRNEWKAPDTLYFGCGELVAKFGRTMPEDGPPMPTLRIDLLEENVEPGSMLPHDVKIKGTLIDLVFVNDIGIDIFESWLRQVRRCSKLDNDKEESEGE